MRGEGMHNPVDDKLGDPKQAQREKGSDQPKNHAKNHN
jgi:hypothetical protein